MWVWIRSVTGNDKDRKAHIWEMVKERYTELKGKVEIEWILLVIDDFEVSKLGLENNWTSDLKEIFGPVKWFIFAVFHLFCTFSGQERTEVDKR